jgi:hypothetical protein
MTDYGLHTPQRTLGCAVITAVLALTTFGATPALAETDTKPAKAAIKPSSRTAAPAALAGFLEDLNSLNERVATDGSLNLVTANELYRKLWKKASGASITLSVPQQRDTASSRRAAKFPTYAAVLSVKHRGISYCVVADRFITTEPAPRNAWSQSLLRGSCSKYFKLVTL